MGCDVTAYAEIKFNGRWEHNGSIRIERNYAGFGFMVKTHLRCPQKRGFEQKKLPDDINPFTKYLLNLYTEHTHSWLKLNEVKKVNKLMEREFIELPWMDFISANNWRLIFGFDS